MKKVLYIDDEVANLRTFSSVFRRDYNVLIASSGKEALAILEYENPDVIITDQCMPEMSGLELLKKIFETRPYIPPTRIMLSGFAEMKDVQVAREKYLLQKFISKPWDKRELQSVIEM